MKQYLPTILLALFFLTWAGDNYRKQSPKSDLDYKSFGSTPVTHNGRIKPLDTISRNALLIIAQKSTIKTREGQRLKAIEWMAELMMDPSTAETRPIFKIYDEDIRGYVKHDYEREQRSGIAALLLGQGSDHFYYSLNELKPHLDKIEQQAQQANQVEEKTRTRSQTAVLQLYRSVSMYISIRNSLYHNYGDSLTQEIKDIRTIVPLALEAFRKKQNGEEHEERHLAALSQYMNLYQSTADMGYFFPLPIPEDEGLVWEKPGYALNTLVRGNEISPILVAYGALIDAYNTKEAAAFNRAVDELHETLGAVDSGLIETSKMEQNFNFLEPFYICMVGYIFVFLTVIVSWIRWPKSLNTAAFYLAVLCLVLHTIGLILRVYISGYAPVTNLYSSAVFVGWGAACLALVLELLFRNGIGNAITAIIGFCTLLIAHHMAEGGDTMEMMRAVLDSNFWLSTHVTIVTLGYSATFVAGAIALLFIVLSVFTPIVDKSMGKTFKSMVYGIVCFATLFSFFGTILGGIWGDQSWGRFWGWDPKENGAVLVVLWNVTILHARWGGYIRTRGLMAMAIFGNVVTAWSWFGTNMLGIGLHSYGFMDAAFYWLVGFVASQMFMIGLAYLPTRAWKSPIKV